MEFKLEIIACYLWIAACLLTLTSVIGSMFSPLYFGIWSFLNELSFPVVAIALFIFSIGLADKNKDLSQLALVSSICYVLLSVLIFISNSLVFDDWSQIIALIALLSASLFLVYLSAWIFTSRYSWKIESPALFAVTLNVISAFFLFFEKLSSMTFYKLEVAYIMMILAMMANIFLFKKVKD